MTALASAPGVRGGSAEARLASLALGARQLATRLREESGRQVPFSQARLLFLKAASAIERLEAELAGVTAELGRKRAGG